MASAKGPKMSFQAYLDNIEKKTGLTPRQFVDLATEKGFGAGTKSAPIVAWLKEDYGLGQGHAMALVHVITKGPEDQHQARRHRRRAQRRHRHPLARRRGDEPQRVTFRRWRVARAA